ncbi:MAG: PAS domain S-box protein [SAR324 cluster bacterium]|nr:PAS domain S-box protein [SAR324 cluster bacterium]
MTRKNSIIEENEIKLQAILETANDGIVIIDENGIIDSFNTAAEKMFGYTKQEIIGKSVNLLIPSPDHEKHDGYLQHYLQTKKTNVIGTRRQVTGVRQDKTVFPLDLAVSEASLGNRKFYTGVMQDITERKVAEAKMNQLSHAVEYSPTILVITNAQGIIEYVNPKFTEVTGYTAEEAIGNSPSLLKSTQTPDELYADLWQTIITGKEWHGEVYNRKKNGEHYWALISISSIKNNQNKITHYVSTQEDITVRKNTENELNFAKEAAVIANQAKSTFLANMSHEIRTPLNSILGFSQILINQKNQYPLPPKHNHYLENIKTAGEGLSELINNILDLSKIEAGKLDLSEEPLHLKQLFKGIYHINKAHALEKKLNYSYDFDENLPKSIISDRTKLNQILMNLTANAIKFTPEGKRVCLRASRLDDDLLFEVIDEGPGIPVESYHSIFETFEQGDNSMTREFGGSGLGLSITRQMVKLLNGTIWVDSQVATDDQQSGSTFFVQLPLKEINLLSHYNTPISSQPYQLAEENVILIVEDNLMNQEMLQAVFEEMNERQDVGKSQQDQFQIHFADDGAAGVEKALHLQKTGKLDLILMDMHMPVMDGMTAAKTIRLHPECANIPIIALSADAFKEQQGIAHKSGISDYITKPIDLGRLITILEKYLKPDGKKPRVKSTVSDITRNDFSSKVSADLKKQLQTKFHKLSITPIFRTDHLLAQVQQIKKMGGDDPVYFPLIEQISNAIFNADKEALESLLQKAMTL